MAKGALTVIVAALPVVLFMAACGSSGSNQATQTSTTTVVVTSPSPSGTQPHNPADVTFAQQMIPHHQQAVQMSDMILAKQGLDPRVSDLATQVKAAQQPEIEQMQGWLTQWGERATPSASSAMMPSESTMPSSSMPSTTMPSGAVTPGMGQMPGMASEQEVTALQNSDGAEAGKLFLTMMIHHHEGAITMAKTEVKSGQNPPAIAMAHSIINTQQQQIDTMQKLLASL
jgi:uncharacterized protein (DUF305 family)